IEVASEQIAKGEFNINLKEGKNKELNEIIKNLNNINKGFKSAVQGELTGEKMKAELITNVSHDLKTPLTSIINYVDLLQKDNLTELQKHEYLNILENKSKRLKVLVEDLHEATKASSGNLAVNLEHCDIVKILNQSLNEFKEKIQHSNLIYKVEIPEEEIILNLDRTKMLRVFDNLIGNTLKYSMNKSRVYVKLKREDEKVKFKIQNISAYELNCEASELKERFKRGDASRHTEGSGLGLAIASTLLELQGGELEIKIDGDLFTVEIVL
ncbi:MAG: sensor histidine kinase, partial [Sarcina sp.]